LLGVEGLAFHFACARAISSAMTSSAGIPASIHPAIPASAHLIPGIKDWASQVSSKLANAGIDSLKRTDWSLSALKSWYTHTDPLHSALSFCTVLSLVVFVLGQATQNASWVDRLWAFLPLIYSAHFAFQGRWSGAGSVSQLFGSKEVNPQTQGWSAFVPAGVDERMFILVLLQILWSLRLNGNTLRRGFFDITKEDYRWPIVRQRLTHWQFVLLDFFFVAFGQNILLLITALPQYLLLTATRAYHPANAPTPVGWPDLAIAGLFIFNLTVEQIADSQQQAFQNWKHGPGVKEGKGARMLQGKTPRQIEVAEGNLRRGFLTSGLWAWSRHPNFLCEQLNFWILSLFTVRATVPQVVFEKLWSSLRASIDLRTPLYIVEAVKAASPHIFNYSWIAGISMTALFYASTALTEEISSGKYPKYAEYQKRVGMFHFPMTIAKGIWLGLTGQLSQVNEQVYGSSKPKKQ